MNNRGVKIDRKESEAINRHSRKHILRCSFDHIVGVFVTIFVAFQAPALVETPTLYIPPSYYRKILLISPQ